MTDETIPLPDPEITPSPTERAIGKRGIAAVRERLAKAAPPSARPFEPIPKPRPIDPSEPREREEPF